MNNIVNFLLRKFPCHRMPERSLRIGSWQMPLCSRCFGITLGFLIGLSIGCLGYFSSRWIGIMFLIPLLIDAGTQQMGCRTSNNALRVVTGLLGGMGVGIFLLLWCAGDITLLQNYLSNNSFITKKVMGCIRGLKY